MTVTIPHDRPLPLPAGPPGARPRVLVDAAVRGGRRLGLPSGLPTGPALRRHAVVLAAGVAGVPALALLGAAAGRTLPAVLVALLGPVALLAAAAARVLPARVRSALTAAAVVAGSCTAVGLSPATTEAHFAPFLAAVLLGLYRDWSVYPVAVAVALLWPDLAGPRLRSARSPRSPVRPPCTRRSSSPGPPSSWSAGRWRTRARGPR